MLKKTKKTTVGWYTQEEEGGRIELGLIEGLLITRSALSLVSSS